MKKVTFVILSLIFSATAFGQSADANASAIIVEPLSITKVKDLVFGSIAAKATATSVSIAASSTATTTTSDATIVGGVLSTSAAEFAITADSGAGYTYSMNLTSLNGFLLKSTNGDTMGVTYDLPNDGTTTANGSQSIYVGGTLSIGANQPAGLYEDTITVTVAYQ